jgi:hypothetical protein
LEKYFIDLKEKKQKNQPGPTQISMEKLEGSPPSQASSRRETSEKTTGSGYGSRFFLGHIHARTQEQTLEPPASEETQLVIVQPPPKNIPVNGLLLFMNR